jgi:hypothetical protein
LGVRQSEPSAALAIIAQISLGFKQLAHGLHGSVLLAGAVDVRISCASSIWRGVSFGRRGETEE